MDARAVPAESIRSALEKVLVSSLFQNAGRSRALLKFIVEECAAGRVDRLKEYTIGAEALGRGDSFDPRTDPIVRAEASRLRDRLERYYATDGQYDPVAIVLPKGTYVPEFAEKIPASRKEVALPNEPAKRENPRMLPGSSNAKWLWIAGVASFLVVAAAAFVWGPTRWQHRPQSQSVQFDVELKSRGVLGSEVGTDVVLSPDGSRLVFVSRDGAGAAHLNTRRLDDQATTELKGTEDARGPFFSPDGEWVAFLAGGKLKKTPVNGGSPVVLCDATDELGGAWGSDGWIIAALDRKKLSRIPETGGTPSVLLDLSSEQNSPVWPEFLPTGDVLFTTLGPTGPNGANIEAISPATGKRTILARGGTFGRYVESGYLTYINQGTLFAVPFDVEHLQSRGTPTPVLEHIAYSPGFGYGQLSFSRTGAMIYRKDAASELTVESQDQAGRTQTFLAQPGHYLWPRLSPQGQRLAFSITESGISTIAIYDRKTDLTTRLPFSSGLLIPLWTRDGQFLIVGGFDGLSWIRADGTGKPQSLLKSANVVVPWSISPDGRRLAFHQLNPATGFDLWTVSIQSSADGVTVGTPEVFLQTPAFETYPSFSPDGKWISYASNESGTWEVYVRQFHDPGLKVRVSSNGGRISFWSPSAHELFYRTDDQRIMVATYRIQAGSFDVLSVRQWTRSRLADTGVLANLDLSTDGKELVYLVPAATPENQQSENHATFILDFFSEISRHVR
jgi:serine/threonine-protein kinase